MPDFQLHFEWEEAPRARPAELHATWARLEIRVGDEAITKVEARRTQSVRSGIYVPLYPIAEWIAANWWFLWDEWRGGERDPRHSLLAAREGFALPDVSFVPTETQISLTWRPTPTAHDAAPTSGLLFLSSGAAHLPKPLVQAEFRRLVEAVLERLHAFDVPHAHLAREWEAIRTAERDPEQRAFCEQAARLGCDPFALPGPVATEIEHLGGLLPASLAAHFFDAISLDQLSPGAQAVRGFVDTAAQTALDPGHWRELRESLPWDAADLPWRDGYRAARGLRERLGPTGPIAGPIHSFLRLHFGSLETRPVEVGARIEAIAAPTPSQAPLFGLPARLREDSRRFILCRALADHLASGLPSLVTRAATERQQRNRAFAAEFLAPAESLRARLPSPCLDQEDVEDLSHEFQVSNLVIRHQIQNHNLASLAA